MSSHDASDLQQTPPQRRRLAATLAAISLLAAVITASLSLGPFGSSPDQTRETLAAASSDQSAALASGQEARDVVGTVLGTGVANATTPDYPIGSCSPANNKKLVATGGYNGNQMLLSGTHYSKGLNIRTDMSLNGGRYHTNVTNLRLTGHTVFAGKELPMRLKPDEGIKIVITARFRQTGLPTKYCTFRPRYEPNAGTNSP